ncbi:MAG: hypothetical protein L0220_02895 [Acidobacteria bacterium]|nr:hypothetical protein [Acidobacteriota bacterium]
MKLLLPIFITLVVKVAPLLAQQKAARSSESVGQETIAAASLKNIKVMREFRGIRLGMKRDDVRDALGKPEISESGKDRFKLGGDDRLTAHYDNDSISRLPN